MAARSLQMHGQMVAKLVSPQFDEVLIDLRVGQLQALLAHVVAQHAQKSRVSGKYQSRELSTGPCFFQVIGQSLGKEVCLVVFG